MLQVGSSNEVLAKVTQINTHKTPPPTFPTVRNTGVNDDVQIVAALGEFAHAWLKIEFLLNLTAPQGIDSTGVRDLLQTFFENIHDASRIVQFGLQNAAVPDRPTMKSWHGYINLLMFSEDEQISTALQGYDMLLSGAPYSIEQWGDFRQMHFTSGVISSCTLNHTLYASKCPITKSAPTLVVSPSTNATLNTGGNQSGSETSKSGDMVLIIIVSTISGLFACAFLFCIFKFYRRKQMRKQPQKRLLAEIELQRSL